MSQYFNVLVFTLGVSLFFFILSIIYKENTRYYGIVGLSKTKRGLWIIEKVSKQKWVKIFDKISYYLGIPLVFIALFFLLYGFYNSKYRFSPVIPGTNIGGVEIPLFTTVIAIFIVAFIHEVSHGILIRYHKIPLKSWGIFFLGPFLGAFVEPDEKKLDESDERKQISIYNAGVVANILSGFLFLVLASLIFSPLYTKTVTFTGVTIIGVENNTPAYFAGIPVNSTLIAINNFTIHSLKDVYNILSKHEPGDRVIIITNKGEYELTLTNKDGKAYMGVLLKQEYKINNYFLNELLSHLIKLFNWLFVISLGIGIANMLPIFGLDGGRTLYAILRKRYGKYKALKTTRVISTITLLLLILNIGLNIL